MVSSLSPTRTTPAPVVPAPRASSRLLGLVLLAGLAVLILTLSLFVGSKALAPAEVLTALLHPDPADPISQIVWQSRVPRTVILLLAGAALGVAGGIMQAVTRNPLTDPGILGVNAGASFAVVVGLTFFAASTTADFLWFSFTGALVTTVIVYAVGTSGPLRGDPVRMTLAGVALGAVLGGMSSALLLTSPQTYRSMRSWAVGTTASQSMDSALTVAPFILGGLLLALASYRALDVLSLGEDSAQALGASPQRIRIVALISITLLAGGTTALCGPISFIGLLAAHLARGMVGPHQGWIMAYCAVGAPAIMALSDITGRVITTGEVPVGVMTAFIGAPLLIIVVRRLRTAQH